MNLRKKMQKYYLKNASAGFKIHDKKEGSKLAKGTKADALKARFIPVKA